MSIELPPIPPLPSPDSTPAQWALYVDILRLHITSEQSAAMADNTAAVRDQIASQQQFMAAMNATPDGVAFGDVLKLVGMLLRMPVEPPAVG